MSWDSGQQWRGDEPQAAPAVFGSEYSGLETEDAVRNVYLPCRRVGPRDREAQVELRRADDERLVMLAFTSLEELVRGCGEDQPWIEVAVDRVSQVQRDTGADAVLWDLELPTELRHKHNEEGDS